MVGVNTTCACHSTRRLSSRVRQVSVAAASTAVVQWLTSNPRNREQICQHQYLAISLKSIICRQTIAQAAEQTRRRVGQATCVQNPFTANSQQQRQSVYHCSSFNPRCLCMSVFGPRCESLHEHHRRVSGKQLPTPHDPHGVSFHACYLRVSASSAQQQQVPTRSGGRATRAAIVSRVQVPNRRKARRYEPVPAPVSGRGAVVSGNSLWYQSCTAPDFYSPRARSARLRQQSKQRTSSGGDSDSARLNLLSAFVTIVPARKRLFPSQLPLRRRRAERQHYAS